MENMTHEKTNKKAKSTLINEYFFVKFFVQISNQGEVRIKTTFFYENSINNVIKKMLLSGGKKGEKKEKKKS